MNPALASRRREVIRIFFQTDNLQGNLFTKKVLPAIFCLNAHWYQVGRLYGECICGGGGLGIAAVLERTESQE